jgi:REP element-mobilizing transposase RayT
MLPSRKNTRLSNYDYSTPGAYFVTICAVGRRHLFGEIKSSEMHLSALGRLLAEMWLSIPAHRGPRVVLDQSMVMPNHIHGILIILPASRFPEAPKVPPLGVIIGSLESALTREWNKAKPGLSGPVCQSGFYEYVIRHEIALQRVREYIINNPRMWTIDRENPKRTGENAFYGWLSAYSKKAGQP